MLFRIHSKDKIPKFGNKYSQKRNIGVSVPISTFIRLWVIYIFPQSVCLFCWRKYVDWSWDYINRSQTHECGNWGWGCAIPRKGIHKWDFRCSVDLSALHQSSAARDLSLSQGCPLIDPSFLPVFPIFVTLCRTFAPLSIWTIFRNPSSLFPSHLYLLYNYKIGP